MSRTPGTSTEGRERRKPSDRTLEALDLRASGLGWDEIAERMGYRHKSGPSNLVRRHLQAAREESARDVVGLELHRLDRMLNAVWQDALRGDRAAIMTVLRLMERRAKYLALDSAELAADGASETEQAIARMTEPEAIERMAALHVEVARRLYQSIRDYAAAPSPSTVAPSWVSIARGALAASSLDALQAETAEWDEAP